MRTRLHTGRSGQLTDAKITFGRPADGLAIIIEQEGSGAVTNVNHLNVVVWTGIRTGGATDAGAVIDNDRSGSLLAMNSAGRTTDQANWIGTVHASIDDHGVVM